MNSTLPRVNASANLCGRSARIGGARKKKENRKQIPLPARHARKPRNLGQSRHAPLPVAEREVGLLLVRALRGPQRHIAGQSAIQVRQEPIRLCGRRRRRGVAPPRPARQAAGVVHGTRQDRAIGMYSIVLRANGCRPRAAYRGGPSPSRPSASACRFAG